MGWRWWRTCSTLHSIITPENTCEAAEPLCYNKHYVTFTLSKKSKELKCNGVKTPSPPPCCGGVEEERMGVAADGSTWGNVIGYYYCWWTQFWFWFWFQIPQLLEILWLLQWYQRSKYYDHQWWHHSASPHTFTGARSGHSLTFVSPAVFNQVRWWTAGTVRVSGVGPSVGPPEQNCRCCWESRCVKSAPCNTDHTGSDRKWPSK